MRPFALAAVVLAVAGACSTPCDKQTCASGCCDSSGVCQVSSAVSCGSRGAACVQCKAGQVCIEPQAVCSSGTVGSGGGGGGGGAVLGGGQGGGLMDAGHSSTVLELAAGTYLGQVRWYRSYLDANYQMQTFSDVTQTRSFTLKATSPTQGVLTGDFDIFGGLATCPDGGVPFDSSNASGDFRFPMLFDCDLAFPRYDVAVTGGSGSVNLSGAGVLSFEVIWQETYFMMNGVPGAIRTLDTTFSGVRQ